MNIGESRHKAAMKRRGEQNANERKSPMEIEAIGNVNGLAVVSLAAHDVVVRAHVRRERILAVALAAAIIAAVCAACI